MNQMLTELAELAEDRNILPAASYISRSMCSLPELEHRQDSSCRQRDSYTCQVASCDRFDTVSGLVVPSSQSCRGCYRVGIDNSEV